MGPKRPSLYVLSQDSQSQANSFMETPQEGISQTAETLPRLPICTGWAGYLLLVCDNLFAFHHTALAYDMQVQSTNSAVCVIPAHVCRKTAWFTAEN